MAEQNLILRMRVEGARVAAADVQMVESRVGQYESRANRAAGATTRMEGGFRRLRGAIMGVVTGGGLLGLSLGIGEAVKNAIQFQNVVTQLGNQIKNRIGGRDVKQTTEQMVHLAESMSLRGGFGPQENIVSLSKLVGVTGNATKATQLFALATNIARGTHLNLAQATRAVMMVEAGRLSLLSRMGIILPKHIKTHEALIELQKRFAGSTDVFNKTAGGAMQNFSHLIDIVGEKLGKLLIPIFTKLFTWLGKFVTGMMDGTGAGGKFRQVIEVIGNVIKRVWSDFKALALWLDHLGPAFKIVVGAVVVLIGAWRLLNFVFAMSPLGRIILVLSLVVLGLIELYRRSKAARDIFKALGDVASSVFGWLKGAVVDVVRWIRDHWGKLGSYLAAPFVAIGTVVSGAFGAVKSAVVDVLNWLIDRVNDLINGYNAAFGWATGNINTLSHIGGGGGAPKGPGFAGGLGNVLTGVGNNLLTHGPGGQAPAIARRGLATGGHTPYSGVFDVGELSRERIYLPQGSYVDPSPGHRRMEADVPLVVQVDGYQVGQAMYRVGLREKSRT